MAFNITYRLVKLARLTWAEVDDNFNQLATKAADLTATVRQLFAGDIGISKAAGNSRAIDFLTAANMRWKIETTSTAEGGSNAGSNFAIRRYNDAGVVIDSPISITRSTGRVDVAQTLFVGGSQVLTTNDFPDLSPYMRKDGTTKMSGNLDVDYAGATVLVGGTAADDTPAIMLRTHSAGAATVGVSGAADELFLLGTQVRTQGLSRLVGNTTFGYGQAGAAIMSTDANQSTLYGAKGVTVGTVGAFALDFATASNVVMRVSAAGNVSIGATTDNGTDKLQVTGSVKSTGAIASDSTVTAVGALIVRTAIAAAARLNFFKDNLLRWSLYRDTTGEAGSNAGSLLKLDAYADDGTTASNVISIARDTQVATWAKTPKFPTATAGDNSTNGATTEFVQTAISGAVASSSKFRTGFRNLRGVTASASVLAVTADFVWLRNAAGDIFSFAGGASNSLDLTTQGLNGRDQVANFNAQWVHVWWISNGTLQRLIGSASLTAPTLTGLTGYTMYAYVGSIRVGATNNQFVAGQLRGRKWRYVDAAALVINSSINANSAFPLTNLSAFVPPNYLLLELLSNPYGTSTTSGGATFRGWWRDDANGTLYHQQYYNTSQQASQSWGFTYLAEVPSVAGNISLVTGNDCIWSSCIIGAGVYSFEIPNGAF